MIAVQSQIKAVQRFRQEARDDPVEWAEKWLGFRAWHGEGDDQADMIRAGVEEKRSIAATSHAVGKTSSLVIADLALWIGFVPDIRIIDTAPTWPQVENIYWAELHQWASKLNQETGGLLYEFWGEPKSFFWKFKGDDSSYMRGVSPESSDAFQGYHKGLVKISIDEGVGVRDNIYRGLWGLLSGGDARCMIATNPTERTGGAWEAWNRTNWKQFTISAFDHPNVKSGKLLFPNMVTAAWVKEMQEYCAAEMIDHDYTKHPEYQSRVLGKWPAEGASGVMLTYDLIDAAKERKLIREGQKQAGVDVARFGADNTALWIRIGGVNMAAFEWHGLRTEQVIAVVDETLTQYGFVKGSDPVVVDAGFNQGVIDGLRMLGWYVIEFYFNGKPSEDIYNSLFDEAAFQMRQKYIDGEVSFAEGFPEPLINKFADECQRHYSLTSGGQGKKRVEPKDAYKKRTKRPSPDLFDSAVMAHWEGGQVAAPIWI